MLGKVGLMRPFSRLQTLRFGAIRAASRHPPNRAHDRTPRGKWRARVRRRTATATRPGTWSRCPPPEGRQRRRERHVRGLRQLPLPLLVALASVAVPDAVILLGEESAFWLLRSDSDDWALILAMSSVSKSGPRAAYTFIEGLLRRSPELTPLKLDDVVATSADDPLINLLRLALKTGPGINRIRFSRNRIGNAFIEDALIYRLQ